jgi:23S rRNA pseudouridine2605 synthase
MSNEDYSGQAGSAQRLQKIIAAAGIASRRKAEELIASGRVQLNGQTVTELGTKADPARDHIRVDGKLLHGPERPRYFVLNKPKGYVTTASDPEGRPTVMDFFKSGERVFPVGRLDYASEGLLLLTNDGDLANALTRAGARVEKTYLVKVSGKPSDSAINQLRHGVMIDRGTQIRPQIRNAGSAARDGVELRPRPGKDSGESEALPHDKVRRSAARVMTAPARIRLLRDADNPWYEMILTEGRNREIRKMFEEIGHHVEKIRRVGYGPLVLDLEPGRTRELTPDEVAQLRRAAQGLKPARSPRPQSPRFAKSEKPTRKTPRPTRTQPKRKEVPSTPRPTSTRLKRPRRGK